MNMNGRVAKSKSTFCGYLWLSVVFLFPIVTGCKTIIGGPPKWLANPKSVYPEGQFMVAVGEGDTRRAAENAAAANLARIFEAHIESDERVVDKSYETTKTFERTTDFTTDINVLSSQTLFNIQHAEAWQDDKGRVHAVAYLDRRETAKIYRDKISECSSRIDFLQTPIKQSKNILKRYAALRAAVQHTSENEVLLQQLKFIHSPSASASAPSYSPNELREALAQTAKQIRVDIEIKGDIEKRITSSIEELILQYGFVIGKPSVLKVDGFIDIDDTGQRRADLAFVRYKLGVQISDNEGTILAAMNEKGREGHVSKGEARIRSIRTLQNAIKANGTKNLDAYFNALINAAP